MKRTLIDCTALQGRSWDRGIGKYAESLIKNLTNTDDQIYGYLISDFSEIRPLENVLKYLRQSVGIENIHIWPLNTTLAKDVLELKRESFIKSLPYDEVLIIDLFEARHHIPITINKFHQIPTTVILHDLIPFEDPKTYLSNKYEAKVYHEAIFDLKKANMILCNSHWSHKSLVSNFKMLSEKAHFVGGGPNSCFRNLKLQKRNQIISVLGDNPRKNVENLVRAWSQLPNDILEKYTLKIVGNFSNERISYYVRNLESILDRPKSIVFTGPISDSKLEEELNASIALFHPALSEGLGLPILEAIAVGIPAISSANTAMMEISREGALLDPKDCSQIKFHLENTIRNLDFRNLVIDSQKEVLNTYNWVSVSNRIKSLLQKDKAAKYTNDERSDFQMPERKKRVAYIAPSKLSKTGIARFAEQLLPYLRDFANVDFIATETITDIDTTRNQVKDYDYVFIQLGNSPHHKNAFKFAANYPSIILYHDIKLGNTLKNLYEEDKDWMPEFKGLGNLKGDQLDIVGLSRISSLALGIIVHSNTAITLLQHLGIPKIKIKKVLHPSLLTTSSNIFSSDKSEDLKEVVSAGFITPNKGHEVLIEAISMFNKVNGKNISLKLIGEAENYYSKQLTYLAKSKAVELEITGYIDLSKYLTELSSSQLAVQLRLRDFGEASGVMTDLLSYGVPTIVNNFGSFRDLPDNVVKKVVSVPNSTDIVKALEDLKTFDIRSEYSNNAKIFTENFGKPRVWAEEVFRFIQSRYESDLVNNVRKHASLVSDSELNPLIESLHDLEKSDASFGYSFKIGSDISNLKKTKYISGIQRATLEIHKNLIDYADRGRYVFSGVSINSDLEEKEGPHPQIARDLFVSGVQNDIENIDALLLLDLNFHFFKSKSFKNLARKEIPIITNIYDVLPITNPEWFPPGTRKNLFIPWIESVLKYSSNILINSNATYVELKKMDFFSSFKGHVHIVPLGVSSDFQREQTKRIHLRTLLVGTIEPRKGHEDALNAFDELHRRGILVELHLVGRQGWMVESLITRITNHYLFNKKLFWHDECSDSELKTLYETSQITLVTSKGEGFGLPLIEAQNYGSTVVARDIPVFREIGQQGVFFFDSLGSNLADIWIEALNDAEEATPYPIRQHSNYQYYAQVVYSILENRLDSVVQKSLIT